MVTKKVFQLQFPVKAYPRYKYSIDIVTKFNIRCQKLFEACGLSEKAIPEFNDVLVQKYVVSGEPDDYIKPEEMVFNEVDVKNFGNVSGNVESRAPVHSRMVVINVAPEAAFNLGQIGTTRERLWLLVREEAMKVEDITRSQDAMVNYTTRARFAKNLCNLLEQYVFQSLKERVYVLRALSDVPERFAELDTLTEDQIPSDIKQYFKQLLEKYYQINTSVDTTSEHQAIDKPMKRQIYDFKMENVTNELRGLDINDANQADVAGAGTGLGNIMEKIKKHVNIVKDSELQRKIADLDGKAQAMYMRSNVPKAEQPDILLTFEPTREEIPKAIFKGIPEATGCGYRFGVFVVYIKQSSNTPKQTLSDMIKPILLRHGIDKFKVYDDDDEIQQLYSHSVGNKVTVPMRTGTLGGFATMSDRLHILASRHVFTSIGDVSVSVDNRHDVSRRIARVKVPSNPLPENSPRLDIAVAKVDHDEVHRCERRFKDRDGNPLNSVLYRGPSQIQVLEGLDVFIWGAMSKPGKGIITMPERFQRTHNNGMEKYIAIEDEEDAEVVFCREGDSGSIICADDPDGRHVNVISMLIGHCHASKSYVSFQLVAGLNQLNQEHGGQFIIC